MQRCHRSGPTDDPGAKASVSQRWGAQEERESGMFGLNILTEFYLQN